MSPVSLAYTGIVAETYDVLVTNDAIGDAEYFRTVIRDGGEPALEVGCGTGRLLLDYVASGLDVEGVDESLDMLRICRRKAEQRGLTVTVHVQAMQTLDLARRFRTLFVPAGSFMLLTDRDDAERALARFHAHLVPGGRVLIPLERPSGTALPAGSSREGVWTCRRQGSRPEDGAAIECWECVRDDDDDAQLRSSTIRYEVKHGGRTIQHHEAIQTTRWYTQSEFCQLLERAGFTQIAVRRRYTSARAEPRDAEFVCVGRRRGS